MNNSRQWKDLFRQKLKFTALVQCFNLSRNKNWCLAHRVNRKTRHWRLISDTIWVYWSLFRSVQASCVKRGLFMGQQFPLHNLTVPLLGPLCAPKRLGLPNLLEEENVTGAKMNENCPANGNCLELGCWDINGKSTLRKPKVRRGWRKLQVKSFDSQKWWWRSSRVKKLESDHPFAKLSRCTTCYRKDSSAHCERKS